MCVKIHDRTIQWVDKVIFLLCNVAFLIWSLDQSVRRNLKPLTVSSTAFWYFKSSSLFFMSASQLSRSFINFFKSSLFCRICCWRFNILFSDNFDMFTSSFKTLRVLGCQAQLLLLVRILLSLSNLFWCFYGRRHVFTQVSDNIQYYRYSVPVPGGIAKQRNQLVVVVFLFFFVVFFFDEISI